MKDNYLYQWETHIIHPLDYSTITVHTFIEETNNQEAITKRKLYQRQHIRHTTGKYEPPSPDLIFQRELRHYNRTHYINLSEDTTIQENKKLFDPHVKREMIHNLRNFNLLHHLDR